MHANEETEEKQKTPTKPKRRLWKKPVRIAAFALACAFLVAATYISYIYAASPASIRKPAFQHYHFRMQIVVNGKAVNFAADKFQITLGQDACSAALTKQPIHFHDSQDQFVHIHWDGMTGGMVLKYYGWDYIGGINGALGYRFDQLPKLKKVPIAGNFLPTIPKDAKLYIYTDKEDGSFVERSRNDFLKKDLEDFFGKKSNLPADDQTSLLDRLFPKAAAHGSGAYVSGAVHDEKLEELNNLLGDVVIFVQKDRPNLKQIENRFNKLAPLPESTCAG
jgi:hypothetical protein